MSPNEFAYWLQGFAELTDHLPNEEQWQSIKDHLALVFTKVTPVRGLTDDSFNPARQRPTELQDVIRRPSVTCSAQGNAKGVTSTC
jgi:hypothetical protein